MKRGIAKFTAFVLAAGLTFGEGGTVLLAAGTDTALVGLSSTVKQNSESKTDTKETASAQKDAAATDTKAPSSSEEAGSAQIAQADETVSQTAASADVVGTTGFVKCDEYLNVRAGASGESNVVGRISNNGSLEILGTDEYGWYHIRSGNVEGYVAGQFVATGEEAEEIAATAGYTTAYVGAELLNLRAGASEDSEIIGSIEGDQSVEVVEDQGEWIKVVASDGTYGYVSADFVDTTTEYATGVSVEEDPSIAQEYVDYMTAQATSPEDANVSYNEDLSYDFDEADTYDAAAYTDTYVEETGEPVYTDPSVYGQVYDDSQAYSYTDTGVYDDTSVYTDAYAYDPAVYGDTAAYTYDPAYDTTAVYGTDLQGTAASMYSQYEAAQAAADAAVANGADAQTVLDTAASAQEAYAAYLEAQSAADESIWGENVYTGVYTDPSAAYTQGTADATQTYSAPAADTQTVTADTAYTDTTTDAAAAQTTDTTADQTAAQTVDTTAQTVDTTAADTAAVDTTATVSSAGQQAADYAVQFVGNPYVWGGESLTDGADCSGFTMAVMNNFGVSLPHNAEAQSAYGTEVSMDDLQPGDLLFYGDGSGIGHVSMYIGDDQVVHASNPTNGILISDVGYRDAVEARRYLE